MPDSFDQWMAKNCNAPQNYSFAQYGRYLEGWRKSMPWFYSGMSIAYDRWAESKWDEIQDMERLKLAWSEGLAIIAKAVFSPVDKAWIGRTPEDAADFMLTFRESIMAAILMTDGVLNNRPGGGIP